MSDDDKKNLKVNGRDKIGKLRSFFGSFRLRLFITILITGIVSIAAMCITAQYVCRNTLIEKKADTAYEHLNKLAAKIVNNMYIGNPQNAPQITSELAIAASLFKGRIIVADNGLKIIYDSFATEEGKNLVSREAIKALRGGSSRYMSVENEYAELAMPLIDHENTDGEPYVGALIGRISLEDEYVMIDEMDNYLTVTVILLSIVLLFICFLSSTEFAKPFKKIEESISHVSDGYIDDRITIGGYSEVKQLSDTFNEMLSRIEQLDASRQEFVSNVSHELKTPITSIKVLADSLITQPDAPSEVYREFLHDINEEIDRENKIITDLLELVKLDRKEGNMHLATVNINNMLEKIMKRLSPIAASETVEIVFESYRNVSAMVDEVKMSLALTNLIENSIKYNKENGRVKVSLNSDGKYFSVTIADTGIGIPASSIDRIFERFYRVDKARARESGGTGLGLAIARSVVLMHNGAIKVESVEGEGTTFVVSIPISFKVVAEKN
ncbi:MAG: ATP-binding protein [Lachnospiraceae bacterium]|nr:ATP-binding protein [Lachnospiraceae bacterium]